MENLASGSPVLTVESGAKAKAPLTTGSLGATFFSSCCRLSSHPCRLSCPYLSSSRPFSCRRPSSYGLSPWRRLFSCHCPSWSWSLFMVAGLGFHGDGLLKDSEQIMAVMLRRERSFFIIPSRYVKMNTQACCLLGPAHIQRVASRLELRFTGELLRNYLGINIF